MPPRKWKYEPGIAVGDETVLNISQCLHAALIPHILYGELTLRIMGIPIEISKYEFIVPDIYLGVATATLQKAGLRDDPSDPSCLFSKPRHEFAQAREYPSHCFHLDEPPRKHHCPRSPRSSFHRDICLYKQSEYLWNFPAIDSIVPAPNDPDFMLVTHPRLPRPLHHPTSQLKMLSPARYIESLLHLAARDLHLVCGADTWKSTLLLLRDHLSRGPLRDLVHPRKLAAPLDSWWSLVQADYQRSYELVGAAAQDTREFFVASGGLPETPWTALVPVEEEKKAKLKKKKKPKSKPKPKPKSNSESESESETKSNPQPAGQVVRRETNTDGSDEPLGPLGIAKFVLSPVVVNRQSFSCVVC